MVKRSTFKRINLSLHLLAFIGFISQLVYQPINGLMLAYQVIKNRQLSYVNIQIFTGKSITTSRDGILLLQGTTELWLSSSYALYSDRYLQTSFSGFSLTSTMNPLTAFFVTRSTSLILLTIVCIAFILCFYK